MQAQAYVDDEHSLQLLLRWTSAFSRSLMWHVREECDLEAEMQVPHMVLLAHISVRCMSSLLQDLQPTRAMPLVRPL